VCVGLENSNGPRKPVAVSPPAFVFESGRGANTRSKTAYRGLSLQTQERSVASALNKELTPTLSDACTNACTSEGENANAGPIDVDLAKVIEAWPTLQDPIKAGISAMIRAAGLPEW